GEGWTCAARVYVRRTPPRPARAARSRTWSGRMLRSGGVVEAEVVETLALAVAPHSARRPELDRQQLLDQITPPKGRRELLQRDLPLAVQLPQRDLDVAHRCLEQRLAVGIDLRPRPLKDPVVEFSRTSKFRQQASSHLHGDERRSIANVARVNLARSPPSILGDSIERHSNHDLRARKILGEDDLIQ